MKLSYRQDYNHLKKKIFIKFRIKNTKMNIGVLNTDKTQLQYNMWL